MGLDKASAANMTETTVETSYNPYPVTVGDDASSASGLTREDDVSGLGRKAVEHDIADDDSSSPLIEESVCGVTLPDDEERSVVSTIEILKRIVPKSDNIDDTNIYAPFQHSFTLRDAAKSMALFFGNTTPSEASVYCNALKVRGFFQRVNPPTSKIELYRLCCHQHVDILNSYYYTGSIDENLGPFSSNPIEFTHQLLDQICKMEFEAHFEYSEVKIHPEFPKFELACCGLHAIDLSLMSDKALTAFGINVYNVMMKYAYIKHGAPSPPTRRSFLSSLKFRVGDNIYSFIEWEHGVLRGNTRAPSQGVKAPFKMFDRRKAWVVSQPDPRIHFCLSIGTKTCPTVRPYSENSLEDELDLATSAFFENPHNFSISGQEMSLSQTVLWYKDDFEDRKGFLNTDFLPAVLRDWIPPRCEKKEALMQQLSIYQEEIKIVPIKFEFELLASISQRFRPDLLKGCR